MVKSNFKGSVKKQNLIEKQKELNGTNQLKFDEQFEANKKEGQFNGRLVVLKQSKQTQSEQDNEKGDQKIKTTIVTRSKKITKQKNGVKKISTRFTSFSAMAQRGGEGKNFVPAGAIDFVTNAENEVLIFKRNDGHLSFPARFCDPDELKNKHLDINYLKDTALRELYEETGISENQLKYNDGECMFAKSKIQGYKLKDIKADRKFVKSAVFRFKTDLTIDQILKNQENIITNACNELKIEMDTKKTQYLTANKLSNKQNCNTNRNLNILILTSLARCNLFRLSNCLKYIKYRSRKLQNSTINNLTINLRLSL